ncbi:glycosyl hydrolase family 47-domain-containing protein [Halteromyces radiatus]|uniref:glycosyl hydrolase family 47-domain-containing protein n=1 Tax=Halteromyces radiatus TaxID=101107 RepID=UPI00222010FD|nr:glycosyl hydrolase family 47-domain-containing protein [Halteromyces radiatus]KAI8096854.1 glycosyl hydrolase family 47-domain-containing protein [Halteromyces radiatus]
MFSLNNRFISKRRPLILICISLLLLFHLWNVTYDVKDQQNITNNNPPKQYKAPDRSHPGPDLEHLIIEHDTKEKQHNNTQYLFQSRLPHIQFDFEPESQDYITLRQQRQSDIKKAFLHGWNGYKKYAMGHDELKPLTNRTNNPFGHWGATLVDSLSTMAIMQLDRELEDALPEVEKITFELEGSIIVFEAIIRYMGGLLSAYELSGQKHKVLIQKAEQLGNMLSPSFDTPTGLFPHQWNPSNHDSPDKGVLVADLSMHLELFTLSYHTKDWSFAKKAQAITNFMEKMDKDHGLHITGLYPTGINIYTGHFTDPVCRLGAMGDSWFEYLLKQHLLVDGSMPQYSRMYLESLDAMKKNVFSQLPGHEMIFVPPFDTLSKTKHITMDHLSCFVPGMLALGSKTFNQPEDLVIAKGTLEACMHLYRTSNTGLGAEMWSFTGAEPYNRVTYQHTIDQLEKSKLSSEKQSAKQNDPLYQLPPRPSRLDQVHVIDGKYHLRPETLESLFVLYRITGDQKYQEYGWEIFQAIEKYCKTSSGYAAVQNVDRDMSDDQVEYNQMDSMESFLFAETFKYLYLLFSPTDVISLDQYVFNTEGHPIRRRHWKRQN